MIRHYTQNILNNFMLTYKNDKIANRIIFYIIIYTLFFYPVIHANYFYIDDLGRSIAGYAGWYGVGRPMADYIMRALNFHHTLSDIAPLTQIMAIVLLSFSSAILSAKFNLKIGIELLAVSFIVCNAYYLGPMSYRFDSLTMSFAVAFSLAPFILRYTIKKPIFNFLFAVFFITLSYNTYQPAVNIFIVLSLLCSIIELKKSLKDSLYEILFFLATLGLASIIYKLELIHFNFIGNSGYAHDHASLLFSPRNIINNIKLFYNFIFVFFQQTQIVPFIYYAGISIALYLLYIINDKNYKDYLLFTITLFILIILMISGIVGPILFLKSPVIAPRVLMSTGTIVFSFFLIGIIGFKNVLGKLGLYLSNIMLVVTFIGQIVISYAYGNAIYSQGIFQSQLAYQLNNILYKKSKGKNYDLFIYGTEPIAPRALLSYNNYGVIRQLLPLPMNWGWVWGGKLLSDYGMPKNIKFKSIKNKEIESVNRCSFTHYDNYRWFDLYKKKNYIIIDFKKMCDKYK